MGNRKKMGRSRGSNEEVLFPVAEGRSSMPSWYTPFIEQIISDVKQQKVKTFLNANAEMVCLYWRIGNRILERQNEEGWGARIIDRIAKDLRDAFSEMKGFSPRNLQYMRRFASIYNDYEFVQRVVAQIPWRTNITLMEKLDDNHSREWYPLKAIENG